MSTTSRYLLEFIGTIAVTYCVIFLAMYYHADTIHQTPSPARAAEKESVQEAGSIPSALVEYYEAQSSIYYTF